MNRSITITITMLLACAAWSGQVGIAAEPFRLMSSQRDTLYRGYLPRVDEASITRLLESPKLILYTEREMPVAYQDWSSGLPGVHSPSYNISANRSEPHGNGNREFPWSDPAGTHRCSNVRAFRFLHLPEDETGQTHPIVWFRKSLRHAGSLGYAWRYPVGTTFGEVLQARSPKGNWYTFELRLRMRELDDWAVDVFRPFPTAADLADAIKERRPQWHDNKSLAALVGHLESPVNLKRKSLSNSHPFQSVFRQTMGVDQLPPVKDDSLVADLLKETPFRSALDTAWRSDKEGDWTAAPTTAARFHVIPAKYDAGFIKVERGSCMRCHKTVNHSVQDFEPGRDWYGRIRGSDGIFSFHPFSSGSVSHNGTSVSVSMNGKLTAAGLVQRYSSTKHPKSVYNSIRQLVE